MKYKVAIFDMDGTIIDSMWIWKELAMNSFTRRGIEAPDDLEQKIFSMNFVDAATFCIEHSGSLMAPEELIEEWTRDAKTMYNERITLKSSTIDLLEHLKSEGYTICLTTANWLEIAEKILDRFEIRQFFDSITVTQEVSRGKTFPDVFLLTAKKHNVEPESCIVFEDSYYAVVGAKAAGMTVIGVYDEYARHSENDIRIASDAYIYSFDELKPDYKLFDEL